MVIENTMCTALLRCTARTQAACLCPRPHPKRRTVLREAQVFGQRCHSNTGMGDAVKGGSFLRLDCEQGE
jgi:hypothetical protein